MADKSIVSNSKLAALANAIRTKGGTSAQLTVDEMAQAVADIPTGSSPKLTTGKATPTTEDLTYVAGPGWDGFSSFLVKAIPNEYVKPEGRVSITENGTYDVSDKAEAVVNVPSSGVDINDGIVVKARNANNFVTEVDYYGEVLPRYIFGAARGDNAFSWQQLNAINFKNANVYLTLYNFFYCGLTNLSTSAIKGRDPNATWKYNNNAQQTSIFQNMKQLITLSLPEFVGFLNHYEIAGCTALKNVYLPKVTKLASYGSNGRGCFSGDTALENVQIGSVGYAVDDVDTNPFINCTQTGLTITLYTTGAYADTAVTNVRRGATNATIIIKASEATTYNGTSYAAGDTILTSGGA